MGRCFYPCGIYMGRILLRPYPAGRRYFYRDCHQIFSGIHPFLVLIQEKDAKRKSRHQGCRPNFPAPEGAITETGEFGQVPERAVRDAGQFDRVPDPFVVRSSFFVPYGYSSGRWMSGLPLSPPPSFGFLGCSPPPVPLPPPGLVPPPPVPPPSPSGFFGASGFF